MPRRVTAKKVTVIKFHPDGTETACIEYKVIRKVDITRAGIVRKKNKITGKTELYQLRGLTVTQLALF